jgi:hypothetical protein
MTHVCVLSYTEAALDAERRLRKGDRQLYCGECARWRWPEECAHEGRLTELQFKAWTARIAREVEQQYPSQEDRYRQAARRRAKE